MKKNKYDFLWFQLKGYDRIRAIYKLRKNINKYGDKFGKKNKILNNILHKDLIGYKFNDLNITRYSPTKKPIYFTNDLIKSKHNKHYSEEKKNSDQQSLNEQNPKIIVKTLLNSQEKQRKSDSLSNSSEGKIKNKYFSKIKNEKKIMNDNNDIENNNSIQKQLFKQKNMLHNYKLFHQVKKHQTISEFFNRSRNPSNQSVDQIASKNNERNTDIINLIQDKDNNLNKKSSINNSIINMSLYNKKIIPKIHILKLKTNFNLIKLQKNYSTSKINEYNKLKAKTKNIKNKTYINKSELKMKKIKIIKHGNINNDSNKSINYGNFSPQKMEPGRNGNSINKGINTSIATSFNFFNRKRIPSYIRLPYINKISFPKVDSNSSIESIVKNFNSNSFINHIFLKDDKNQFINKILQEENVKEKIV